MERQVSLTISEINVLLAAIRTVVRRANPEYDALKSLLSADGKLTAAKKEPEDNPDLREVVARMKAKQSGVAQ